MKIEFKNKSRDEALGTSPAALQISSFPLDTNSLNYLTLAFYSFRWKTQTSSSLFCAPLDGI